MKRRQFLQAAAAVAAGLTIPVRYSTAAGQSAALAPNAFIHVASDGRITLTVHRSEMGQGIRTALAMVMAEELDADWSRVTVLRAEGDAKYGDQDTVGDASFLLAWTPVRTAAAAAREMLVAAASRQLNVPAEKLRTENGKVLAPDGRTRDYGQLVDLAALEAVPEKPGLKSAADYRLVGKPTPGVDLAAQTNGSLIYGIDVRVPKMQYAVIERAPLPGQKLRSHDAAGALRTPGVTKVFALAGEFHGEGEMHAGVAVVGRDSWSCIQGRKALRVEWESIDAPDSTRIREQLEAAARAPGSVYRSAGDVEAARKAAARTFAASYYTPLLTHATMEPPVCTASVANGRCEVWAPTQNPGTARERIAAALGIPIANVRVNVTAIGSGFGRKSMHDFVLEAVRVSSEAGTPVKLFWTREDDIRHGYFKSPSVQALEAGLDGEGRISFWRHLSVHSSQQQTSEAGPLKELQAYELLGGVTRFPYEVPNTRFEGAHVDVPLKRSWMRGVQDTFHAFATNAFLDEIAQAMGRDPVDLRLELLGADRRIQFFATRASTDYWFDTARMKAVIRQAAELAGWRIPIVPGHGRGFAVHQQSGTYVAMVADVERQADRFRVHKITCVVDCGLVVNSDSARGQVEGGILYGLSSALTGEITLANGRVAQGNFHDYPVARMGDTPRIEVQFAASARPPTGLGETCVPLVAPALVNAIAAAGLGRRRELPLFRL